ncbi:MAG: LacI family DNA-binding transcriptional regulator [Arachnia sp.]
MAATMQDVARLAGVSAKTVSNVINETAGVRPETRRRVESAIAKLGYELNITARNLRQGRTGLISLALPELKLPYFAELADSVIVEAERAGLRVLIEQTNADRSRELDVLHAPRRFVADGVLFSPLALGQADLQLFNVDFPMVLLGERVFGSANDHVTMSNVDASAAATAHLLGLGRRRIALIGSHPGENVGSAALREQGFRNALASAGVPVDEELIGVCQAWHRVTGQSTMDAIIAKGKPFDAVFALNDALAMGVLHSLHLHGIEVPEDVAVIGFDDIEDASYTRPTLSSVSPGRAEIARTAVTLLADRIESTHRPAEERPGAQTVVAEFQLMLRESTGH